jgi:ABC-type transport system involved in multi-copper enzyme maturation permease subunit
MLKYIIMKELLDNFKSLRMSITFILVVAIMLASGLLFVADYKEQLSDHNRNVKENLDKLSDKTKSYSPLYSALSFSYQWVYRTPNKLSFLAEGHEKDLPNAFQVDAFKVEGPVSKLRSNFLLWRFEDIDWAFIVAVIVSFAATVLTYDSISGEREKGTLRLITANSISRSTILLGKYLGAIISLMIPLLTGILLSLTIITLSGLVELSGGDWGGIGFVVLLSFFLISAFTMLGLMVSSMTREASTSLIILLFAWVILAMVIPNTGGLIATSAIKMPGQEEALDKAQDAANEKRDRFNAEHPGVNAGGSGNWSPTESLTGSLAIDDAWCREYDNYRDMLVKQVRYAQRLMRISPAVIYQHATQEVAGTGISHYERFMTQVRRYRLDLRQFLLDKYPLDPLQNYWGRWDEFRAAMEKVKVDFNEIPKFEDKLISADDAAQNIVWNFLLLCLFNVVFFMGAYASFLRYDVR